MGKLRTSRASRCVEEWLSSGTTEDPHTQGILAERLSALVKRDVAQSTISGIKNGSQPRADIVAAFKVLLGIDAEWWLPDAPSSDTAVAESSDEEVVAEPKHVPAA